MIKKFAVRSLMIRVPSFPPNKNDASMNFYVNHKQEKSYASLVRACAIDARNKWEEEAKRKWETLEHGTMSVSFLVPKDRIGPLPDAHNLWARGGKAIDELTARSRGSGENLQEGIGLIIDDSPEHLKWGTINVFRVGQNEVTEILLTSE